MKKSKAIIAVDARIETLREMLSELVSSIEEDIQVIRFGNPTDTWGLKMTAGSLETNAQKLHLLALKLDELDRLKYAIADEERT